MLLDYGYQETNSPKPVVIFAHGFKGFKDWGHFNEIMDAFIENGFVFVKFNFSHNGGTIEEPIDFPDLESFGMNNYSKELDDLKDIVDWVMDNNDIPNQEINKKEISLIGHSRGGGIAVLAAYHDERIKRLITWAAVADFEARLPEEAGMKQWEEEGVIYIENGRTKQQMPMYYQFAEDLLNNREKLNIGSAASQLNIPYLIIHGSDDEAVKVSDALYLSEQCSNAELLVIKGGGHTFGAKHPHTEPEIHEHAAEVLSASINFCKA